MPKKGMSFFLDFVLHFQKILLKNDDHMHEFTHQQSQNKSWPRLIYYDVTSNEQMDSCYLNGLNIVYAITKHLKD